MSKLMTTALQLCGALLVLGGLFAQIVVIPALAHQSALDWPGYAPYVAPFVTVAVVLVALGQVALLGCLWMLQRAKAEALFAPGSLRPANLVVAACGLALAVALGFLVWYLLPNGMTFPEEYMDDITLLFGAVGAVAVLTVAVIAALVGRAWLRRSIWLQSEVEAVI